jgi:hypothetical protein
VGRCIRAIVASTRWESMRISRTRLAACGRYEGKRSGREAENVAKAESISCSDNWLVGAATAVIAFCRSSSRAASVSPAMIFPFLASRATTTRASSSSALLLLPLPLPSVSLSGALTTPSCCCASS